MAANLNRPYVCGSTLGSFLGFVLFLVLIAALTTTTLNVFHLTKSENHVSVMLWLIGATWLYVALAFNSPLFYALTAFCGFVVLICETVLLVIVLYDAAFKDSDDDGVEKYAGILGFVLGRLFWITIHILTAAACFKLGMEPEATPPPPPKQQRRQIQQHRKKTLDSVEKNAASSSFTSDTSTSSSSSSSRRRPARK